MLGVYFSDNKVTGKVANKFGSSQRTVTPLKLRVDCYLYHGCDILCPGAQKDSQEVYFNNNVTFD
jgi:hypothetical protein